jgi:hypothetical protein
MGRVSISQSIQPTQRAVICYNASASVPLSCRTKTSLVLTGREHVNPGRIEAAAAGAFVAAYFNLTTYVTKKSLGTSYLAQPGTYHAFFASTASGGPQLVPLAQGGNGYNPSNPDDRWAPYDLLTPGTATILSKLEATIDKLMTDHPYINTLFLDDCGPDWTGYYNNHNASNAFLSAAQQESFYQVHVAIAQKYDQLAAEYNLLLVTNGEWRGPSRNHGYPQRGTHGCSLYDVFCVEHHSIGEAPYWDAVASGQWRLRDPQGQRLMFHICNTSSDTTAWRNRTHVSHIAEQTTPNYTANPPNVSSLLSSHDLGVSTGTAPSVTVSVSPVTVTVQTGTTQQFTATVSNSAPITTWSVNGVAGGTTTVGTISSSGLYTAPTAVPAGGVVTISAQIATGQAGTASVTIQPTAPDPPETELPPPPEPMVREFGNRFSGLIPNNMSPDFHRGVIATAPEDGTVTHITVGIDGGGPGTANQPFKCRIYAVDEQGATGALLASSGEYTISDGAEPAWPSLVLDTPLDVTGGSSYLLTIHSGGTESTGRFFRNEVSGVSRSTSDVYADGPVDPFAPASTGAADISIFAEYTPAGVTSSEASVNMTVSLGLTATPAAQSDAITNWVYVMVPVVKTVAVPYQVLDDTGTLGPRLRWIAAEQKMILDE